MNFSLILVSIISIQTVFMFNIDFQLFGELLDHEKQVINSMKEYIKHKEVVLKTLNDFVSSYEESVAKNVTTFWENPILTYFAIKRIIIEWNEVLSKLGPEKELISNKFIGNMKNYSIFHYQDAADSIARITAMYDLDIKSLVKGIIKYKTNSGEQKTIYSNKTFDAFDCYNIGLNTYLNTEFLSAQLWLEEGLKMTNTEDSELQYKILGLLSKIFYKLGKKSKAFDYLQQSLSILGTKEDDMDNMNTFSILLNEKGMPEEFLQTLILEDFPDINFNNSESLRHLADLCQGRYKSPTTPGFHLKCYHLNTTLIPYLRLNRIRVEELHKRPQILFFHNFLSEYELQTLKELFDKSNETFMLRLYNRMSENLVLPYNESKVMVSIVRRIEAITGLPMNHNFPGEVHKYFTGELYWGHKDGTEIFRFNTTGEMASIITYWNDVEAGGATIFSKLNITVWPEKYSALMFFNYKLSGQYDEDLEHGGCPLLIGMKQFDLKMTDYIGTRLICLKNKEKRFKLKI